MRYLYAVLLLSLACRPAEQRPSTLNQSALRTPPRPPIFTPTEDAPHTVGQPGHLRPERQVEPSPKHKRVLPQDETTRKHPGFWASDVPRDLPATPKIDGVVIPFPVDAATAEDRFLTSECAMMVDGSKGVWDPLDLRLSWTPAQRRCMAATLFHACIYRIDEINAMRRTNGELFRDVESWLPSTKRSADSFLAASCRGVTMPPKYMDMVGASNKPIGILLLGPVQRVFK